MDQAIEITGTGLSAGIVPLGAELSYLRDGEGRDLLWDGDPAYWTGRAPLLFPIVGALRDDSYRFDGATYHLPKHGFARRSRFTLVEQAAETATFRLDADDETRTAYPFDFRLDIRFAIAGATLTMTASVTNRGERPMPASFGFHPALRWPLPYGRPRAAHRLRFERPEPAPIRRIDDAGLLMPDPRPSPIDGDTLTLDDVLFEEDAIILDRPASRRLLYGATDGPQLDITFPGMPQLGIWTKPGAGYVCIEPWQGFADPVKHGGDILAKPGILILAPGVSRDFSISVTLTAGG